MKKKWYASDMAFKIYSVLIAILLWIFVIYDQNPESTKIIRNIPVYYSNLDELEKEGYTVLRGEEEPSVDLKIKGKRLTLGKLAKKSVSAYVTFGEMKSGEYDLSVEARLPSSEFSVIDKKPGNIHVTIEKLAEKKLDVGIDYFGENEDGKLASAQPEVQTITVTGAESVINTVESAKFSIDYNSVFQKSESESAIQIYDKDGNDITDNVNIKLSDKNIKWKSKIYNVKDVSVDMVFADDVEYTVDELRISESAVKLCCNDDKTLDFDSVQTKPVSAEDAEKIKEGESIEVELKLPEHVSILRQESNGRWTVAENNKVKIEGKVSHVEKIPLKTGENLDIYAKDENKEYVVVSKPEYIFVKCAEEVSGDVWNTVFYINADNLSDGEHAVPIEANLPENAQMVENYDAKIVIKSKK